MTIDLLVDLVPGLTNFIFHPNNMDDRYVIVMLAHSLGVGMWKRLDLLWACLVARGIFSPFVSVALAGLALKKCDLGHVVQPVWLLIMCWPEPFRCMQIFKYMSFGCMSVFTELIS